ncbi:hypothetical protein JCGZ_01254 [Jatropha curcas]|uniref:Uncharacterized protein n=1 Tax=Jatropha curcas TaxID=180498 RepID=A0A067LKC4_JATCU|nr:uncharacterized protein LOC105646111 [Jatropha curcas]KDP44754.1 hypothetical protein JCGZ_01254 [Jatropha curcas]
MNVENLPCVTTSITKQAMNARKENIRVADISSELSESDLLELSLIYGIPPNYRLILPTSDVRIIDHLNADQIMVYEEDLRVGVRFPLSKEIFDFLNTYEVTLSQIEPNSLCMLIGLSILAARNGCELTMGVVNEMYDLKFREIEDHYYLSAKDGFDIFSEEGKITSMKGNWKKKFFILQHPTCFGIPTTWSFKPLFPKPQGELTLEERKCVVFLRQRGCKAINLSKLLAQKCLTYLDSRPLLPRKPPFDMASKGKLNLNKLAEQMKKNKEKELETSGRKLSHQASKAREQANIIYSGNPPLSQGNAGVVPRVPALVTNISRDIKYSQKRTRVEGSVSAHNSIDELEICPDIRKYILKQYAENATTQKVVPESQELARLCLLPTDKAFFDRMDIESIHQNVDKSLFMLLNANHAYNRHIHRLKGLLTEEEIKKNELHHKLELAHATMVEQTTRSKKNFEELNYQFQALKLQYQANIKRLQLQESLIYTFKSEITQLKNDLRHAREQEAVASNGLTDAMIAYQHKIVSELNLRHPGRDWNFIYEIFPENEHEVTESRRPRG